MALGALSLGSVCRACADCVELLNINQIPARQDQTQESPGSLVTVPTSGHN